MPSRRLGQRGGNIRWRGSRTHTYREARLEHTYEVVRLGEVFSGPDLSTTAGALPGAPAADFD
ncbi:hypothetical protein [Streptomyces sp. VRA16 Mangrove soil]|uniref:hypothetical protein n=1 Tax=Streptomyces sp. VRA16 Mangrove soil TaxID=2817434 RepID=UPI001A9F15CB|nr:hypothetical protein [Streptomyces sp. VRA16 Mangrove soil]